MASIHGGAALHFTNLGNTYWVDPALTGPEIQAVALAGSAYSGVSLSEYQGFTAEQQGDAERYLRVPRGEEIFFR